MSPRILRITTTVERIHDRDQQRDSSIHLKHCGRLPGFRVASRWGFSDSRNHLQLLAEERGWHVRHTLCNLLLPLLTIIRFLWVRLQIEEICSQRTDDAILETLDRLPKGLPNTFNRILRKMQSSQIDTDIRLCQSLFQIVSGARRPLKLVELQEAVSIDPERSTWDPRTRINDIASSLSCAGSLLIVDEEDGTVHFAHSSVKQHLHTVDLALHPDLISYHLDPPKADLRLAEITVTYLKYSRTFDKQLMPSQVGSAERFTDYSSLILKSVSSQYHTTTRLARWYSKAAHKSRIDASNEVGEAYRRVIFGSLGVVEEPEPYPFLAYAHEHWLSHSKAFAFDIARRSRAMDAFEDLVHGKLDSETLSWHPHLLHYGGNKLMKWLVETRHWPIIKLFIKGVAEGRYEMDSGPDDEYDVFAEFLRGLPNEDEPVDVNDIYSQALFQMVSCNLWVWARVFIEKNANVNVEREGKTALEVAAFMNFGPILSLLIRNGADVNAKGMLFGGALIAACLGGHQNIVRTLLRKGATIAAQPQALSAAFKKGNPAILKLLREPPELILDNRD